MDRPFYNYNVMKVDQLIPYARNARTHSDEQVAQIAASIREFGFTNPVLVSPDKSIIAGHGRVLAARKLGMDQIPAILVEGLTEAQQRALVLADNKLALNAGWDADMLKIELADLQMADFDLSVIGFSTDELADLLADKTEGLTDPDAVPDVQAEAISKPGDLWTLGRHRLVCGDSTQIGDVQLAMDWKQADMVFTSPPYNVGIDYGLHDDNKTPEDYRKFMVDVLTSCWSAMSDGRLIAWNVGVSPKSRPFMHAIWMEEAGFDFYRQIVWKKTGAQIPLWQNSVKKPNARRYMPNYNHELIYMGVKGKVDYGASTRMPEELSMDVWDVSQFSAGGNNHPAAFPIKLASLAVEAMSAIGETIFEPFSGSGTMIMAAETTQRKCCAIEIDPRYVDVAIRRWQDFTGQKAVIEATGKTFDEMAGGRKELEDANQAAD